MFQNNDFDKIGHWRLTREIPDIIKYRDTVTHLKIIDIFAGSKN